VKPRRKERLQAVRQALRARGLRATPARIAVLDTILVAAAPISHGEIATRLVRLKHDRATIFRNLASLTRARLALRVDIGDHVWRFVANDGERTWRVDFLCTSCGTVEALDRVALTVAMARAPRAIARREIEVHIHGRCNGCA